MWCSRQFRKLTERLRTNRRSLLSQFQIDEGVQEMASRTSRIPQWHVSVAAEAFAAALFARCGVDVAVQYGANQPEYDLVVSRDDKMLKVSVKGSQDGGWGLTQ